MKKKKSKILEMVLETAQGLNDSGLMDQVTLRQFKELCLEPVEEMPPSKIKKIREKEQVSQGVFAGVLNTSISTIQKWETGEKKPSGAALKLLHVVRENGLESIMYAGSA